MMTAFGNHPRPIELLCFVCGGFFKENGFKWEDYKSDLTRAFYIKFSTDSVLCYPPKFCKKCYFKMKNILKRPTASMNAFQTPSWLQHPLTGECKVCDLFDKNKNFRGGKVAKNEIRTGKPISCEPNYWTRDASKALDEKFKSISIPPSLTFANFDERFNPHLPLCICSLCHNLMEKATIVSICEHAFCLKCILQKVEGTFLNKITCPVCGINVLPENIVMSRSITHLLCSLKLHCIKDCGKTFCIGEGNGKTAHEKSCQGKMFTLVDILEFPTTEKLPALAEKAAASVIKHKIANSNLPNKGISITTGGSRVSYFHIVITF